MTEVATTGSNLPALAPTPALDAIGSDDIALPKLYKGEYQSQLVQDDVVPKGSIFVASGPDDPDPQVVWEMPAKGKEAAEGVLVHVLDLKKGKSISVDGDLQTFAFDDPAAPDDAWATYQYVVVLPEVDEEIPVKLLLTKTSAPTAKRINFLLKKNESRGPAYATAFRLTTVPREKSANGQTYKWFVWQARQVEADPKHVAIAETVSAMVAQRPTVASIERTAGPGNEPGI